MNPFLIAGLLGAGAGFLSRDKKKSRMKMAHGGQVPDHLIDVLSSQTTLRKSALQKFVKDNHFSKDDVVSIISGIGRGQIEPMDVGMAVLMGIGSSENEKLVEFAKSGKAFDLARGGRVEDHLREADTQIREAGSKLWKNKHPKSDELYEALMQLNDVFTPRELMQLKYARGGGVNDGSDDSVEIYIFKNDKGTYTYRFLNNGKIQEEGSEDTKEEAALICSAHLEYYSMYYAKGGTTSDAEERAFAEYMEDYGVDREEAEEQFLGEFDSKADWAAEFVDDTGGMESLIDPERFYRIDTDGFRQFALDEASERSADIDKDNADEYAEKFDLEEEYEEAVEEDFHIRTGALSDFITMLQEKEEEAVLDDLMRNYTTADEIINNLGPNYGMGLDDLENAYLIMPDYDEVADALEDDGYVFIEEDFKTFVFNPNMARGGRTKRMKKGGKVYDSYDEMKKDYDRYDIRDAFEDYIYDRISHEERRKIRQDWNDMDGYVEWETYLLKRVNEKSYAKGGKVKGLDKYGSWYYMDDDGTLFVRAQEIGQDKAPKWDEDDDEWGVVDSRAFGTMERQEFDRDMKKLFGRKPKLG